MTIISVLAVFGIAFFGWKATARAGYETAEYSVVKKDGQFEIREYPELKMATTSMNSKSKGSDGSFMRLFRYISGANDRQQKVAMTTPVFMESENGERKGRMGFVIPQKVAEQIVPEPSNKTVQIQTRSGGRYAVIRFAGRMNKKLSSKSEGKLREWMKANDLTGGGDVEIAGYDPPWTPGPLRRNEILIRLR